MVKNLGGDRMEWQRVKSLEELQQLGKLKDVASSIQDQVQGIKVPKNSWQNLLQFIQTYTEQPTGEELHKVLDWKNSTTLEDLKKLGKLKDVKAQIEQEVGHPIKAKGWQELYLWLKGYRSTDIAKVDTYQSPYFKDELSEIIFYLLELDGEVKFKKLGITKLHYKDKKEANQWKNDLMKKIHPDQNNHLYAEEATKELNKMYGSMIKFAK